MGTFLLVPALQLQSWEATGPVLHPAVYILGPQQVCPVSPTFRASGHPRLTHSPPLFP
jgi:hypothetical protein